MVPDYGSGSHVQELFGGGREHRIKGGGQLSALIGQVVAATVGGFSDEAMIAQEAKVPTDASGELLIATAGAPSGIVKHLAQTGVGDARDCEGTCCLGAESPRPALPVCAATIRVR